MYKDNLSLWVNSIFVIKESIFEINRKVKIKFLFLNKKSKIRNYVNREYENEF